MGVRQVKMHIFQDGKNWLKNAVARLGIASRFISINILGIAVVTVVFILITIARDKQITTLSQQNQYREHYETFLATVDAQRDTALALAISFARQTDIQKAFAEQNRPELTRLTMPTYIALDNQLDIPQCQFHLPGAISFLRLHDLTAYEDDLSSFRQSVLDAQNLRENIGGVESGRGGLGIRGVAPVWYGPDFIGTVEFGMNLDRTFLKEYSRHYQFDVSVYLMTADNDSLLFQDAQTDALMVAEDIWLYASTLPSRLPVPESIYDQVRESDAPVVLELKHEGENYNLVVGPLYDYAGQLIGLIELSESNTEAVRATRRSMLISFAVAMLVIALAGLTSYFSTRSILKPLKAMSQDAQRAAQGDLAQHTTHTGSHEIGILATAFDTMIASLNQILDQITSTAPRLSSSGTSLASAISQMYVSIEQISTTTQEMAQGAGTQARRVEEASLSMHKLATTTGQISINAHSTGETSTSALQMVDDVKNLIEVLAEKASRIEIIVTNVDKIARKTNLLALNASIEAVRAGDYGFGFAVVAKEVRRLAENSSQLVSEIAALNQDISTHLKEIQVKTQKTQQAVAQNAIYAQETAITIREQELTSDAMVDAINEIAVVAEENAVSSEQMALTVKDQVDSLDEINKQVRVLVELAANLQDVISHFTTT